ncbi:hypothetical protein BDZ45DRAFT_670609 [Acephala macrosclerotiorum]|nr:hypothetical protein BDZ45DRAFT_670609 [Acephala macrosclerotiorum]
MVEHSCHELSQMSVAEMDGNAQQLLVLSSAPELTTTTAANQELESTDFVQRSFDTFEPFLELPVELQLKIWGYALWVPRTIEVLGFHGMLTKTRIWGYQEDDRAHSPSYRLSKRSRVPPALFHTCHNSRDEGKKVYKKYFLKPSRSKRNKKREPSYAWFNPEIDSLLFGVGVCGQTMTELFRDNNDLRKVVYILDNPSSLQTNCRSPMEIMHAMYGEDDRNALQASKSPEEYLDGCRGLKEISFVSRSDVWDTSNDNVDPTRTTFRTPVLEGRDYSTIQAKAQIMRNVPLFLNKAKWAGDLGPAIRFLNFAPLFTNKKLCIVDSISFSRYPYEILVYGLTEDDIKDFQKQNKCLLFTQKVARAGEKRGEIGLFGKNKEEIELAKGEIKKMLPRLMKQLSNSMQTIGRQKGEDLAIVVASREVDKYLSGLHSAPGTSVAPKKP